MIDARIANNIIGFMDRAPLKAGVEVPAFNEARSALEGIIKVEDELRKAHEKKLAAEKQKQKDKKDAEKKKKPRRTDGAKAMDKDKS